ncbi:MAG: ABC transporter ATP-binding protein [Phreatobacter sp.]|uniref:ABC transporter ATP-binding protein n=1 Tax=Phreatobacter sp. TaxID=1966341 RepID=UPI001A5F71E8|nr:ABC transporter ATP-binding protein [Phreatobacter sp.]MBL8568930.1 ABC transporter ATP-binding protein [Phreatobacter sp.]
MNGLVLDRVSVNLGGRTVVDGVSAAVPAGNLTVIVGPNGAGKTSLLRAFAGLLLHGGTISLDGIDIAGLAAGERARRIGYLPQRAEFAWALPVRDAVGLGRLPHGDPFGRLSATDRAAVDAAMERLDLIGFASRPVTELSGGERARVMLARVLATGAPLLVLDEPTAALDAAHQFEVMDLMRALAGEGRTVVAVLHDLTMAARFADRILVLDGGRAAAFGAPDQVLTEARLAEVFGLACAFIDIGGRRVPVPAGRMPR